jgi:hypothetical protein
VPYLPGAYPELVFGGGYAVPIAYLQADVERVAYQVRVFWGV